MSKRHRPPSRSYQAGKRGRHKHMTSRETRRWEDDNLPPAQPVWMPRDTYLGLMRMRGEL